MTPETLKKATQLTEDLRNLDCNIALLRKNLHPKDLFSIALNIQNCRISSKPAMGVLVALLPTFLQDLEYKREELHLKLKAL